MKINAHYFDHITSEPLEIQNIDDWTIEIYSLNDYQVIYDTYIKRGQFSCWCNKGGKTYKLLIEDTFHEEVKDLYTKEVNAHWIEYYNQIDIIRTNSLKFHFIPSTVIAFGLILLLSILIPQSLTTLSFILALVVGGCYLLTTNYFKIKNSRRSAVKKNEAVDKIEKLLGKTRFNQILDKQEKYTKEFYKQNEEQNEDLEKNIEIQGENTNENE